MTEGELHSHVCSYVPVDVFDLYMHLYFARSRQSKTSKREKQAVSVQFLTILTKDNCRTRHKKFYYNCDEYK